MSGHYEPSLNPPEEPDNGPSQEDLCEHCREELAERGERYCSQDCAYQAGVSAERERCLDIADNYSDVDDGPDGTPRPNMAMQIMTKIGDGQ